MDWRHRAACLTEDPELFFPIGNSGPALAQVEQAKAVCNRCEVRDTCLKWALETGQDVGVWGGMSEEELCVESAVFRHIPNSVRA
ncbi:WhiB family transcriptional regulator, partial [Flaviflexus sp.]|uniref:WhiB family transcriptional regulator n=1 Tax=Flaviflexus sp. TaxID=1969482 RepID=UPI003F934AD2